MTMTPPKLPYQEQSPANRPINRRMRRLIASFGVAFVGIWYLFRTQRNAQIHLLIIACVLALSVFLPLQRWEWLGLILTCALVLSVEGLNTALEAAVDIASPEFHPLAKVAKDVAAGSVLMCAIAVFIPHLWPILWWLLGNLQ
jgi:diacylglycerol kinase (ATP)